MTDESITPEDVAGRARVGKMAPSDPIAALAVARLIKHPWYRCQSLASVAEHIENSKKVGLLLEALDVAKEQSEINRVVSVSAWPIRRLVKIKPDLAAEHVKRLEQFSRDEPHNLRRADALYTLAWAVDEDQNLLKLIVPSLVKSLLGGKGWRIDRLIRNSIKFVNSVQPESVIPLVAHHGENGKKRKFIQTLRDMRESNSSLNPDLQQDNAASRHGL